LFLEEFTTIAKVACPGTNNNIESNGKQNATTKSLLAMLLF
jgi:hypothetical protein